MKRVSLAAAAFLLCSVALGAEDATGKHDPKELLQSIPVLTEADEKIENLLVTMTVRMDLADKPVRLSARAAYQKPGRYSLCIMDGAGLPIVLEAEDRMLIFDSASQKVLSVPMHHKPFVLFGSKEPGNMQCLFGPQPVEDMKAGKPGIHVDIASMFAGCEDRLTAAASRDGTVVLVGVSDRGNEVRAFLIPGKPFPCVAFELWMKDEKESRIELKMTVNDPAVTPHSRLPDVAVLKKTLEVVETPPGMENFPAAVKDFLRSWMGVLMVRMTPDTPEGRAQAEKVLGRKIDWAAAKEFDRKTAEAYRKATKVEAPPANGD